MLNLQARRQSGVSLVELMVGIVVGLIVLLGISSVYVNSARSSRTATAANQLNQDMRAVMDIMVNDLRRAGFWSTAVTGTNPFTAAATNIRITSPAANNDCILYSYDAPFAGAPNGAVDTGTDFFGFRLTGGAIQTLQSTTITSTATVCANINADSWSTLTDNRAIAVTRLTFDSVGSRCIAFVQASYDPSNAATFTTWTTTAGTTAACNETVNNNNAAASVTAVAAAGNNFMETRQIQITLTANSLVDTTLTRSLTETVLVRNNRLIP